MTNKTYQERLRKSNRLMKGADPDVLLHTKPSNMFCLTADGRLCAYAKIPQEGKVALGDPQTDVKDVKSLAHFEVENTYFRQIRLSILPQRFPQYIEVPPNIESKQIVSYFSPVLSYSYNPLLLKDDSKL